MKKEIEELRRGKEAVETLVREVQAQRKEMLEVLKLVQGQDKVKEEQLLMKVEKMTRAVLRGVEGVDKVEDSMLVDEDEEWGREEEEEFREEDMMSSAADDDDNFQC